MDLDLNRWHALVEARRNCEDDGPTPLQLHEAQSAAAHAQSDLDRYRARGATGQADGRRNSPADVVAAFARGIDELEAASPRANVKLIALPQDRRPAPLSATRWRASSMGFASGHRRNSRRSTCQATTPSRSRA